MKITDILSEWKGQIIIQKHNFMILFIYEQQTK